MILRRFKANSALARGEQDEQERSTSNYRLSDVRVGDKVLVVLHEAKEDVECAAVRIRRRPGGAVPPAPFEDPDSTDRYHEMMNAWQAFEEKGIPLPAKYDPAVQRAKDEYVAKHVRELEARQRWLKDHTAPPPRPSQRN